MTVQPKISPADFECLKYEVTNHVAVVTLNRPERRNALNRRAYDEVESAFRAASVDNEVRCVKGCTAAQGKLGDRRWLRNIIGRAT